MNHNFNLMNDRLNLFFKNEISPNEFAKMSHCISMKCGAVAVKNNRIIATGYNGTPTGYINCDEYFNCKSLTDKNSPSREQHHTWSNIKEIHAELNIILYCAKNGIILDGTTLYSNIQPCIQCTKNLIQSGIIKVVYEEVYDFNKDYQGMLNSFVLDNKIEFIQLKQ